LGIHLRKLAIVLQTSALGGPTLSTRIEAFVDIKEMQHMEHDVVIKQESAREERESGATTMEDITT
jgi:hypothetical protein